MSLNELLDVIDNKTKLTYEDPYAFDILSELIEGGYGEWTMRGKFSHCCATFDIINTVTGKTLTVDSFY